MAVHLETVPAGTDIVVRALPAAGVASGDDLARDLSSCVGRALSRVGQDAGTVPVVSQ
jgi:hypothetical protein